MPIWFSAAMALVAVIMSPTAHAQDPKASQEPRWQAFLAAAGSDKRQADAALEEIASRWRDAYAALIVDVARFLPSPRRPGAPADPSLSDFDESGDITGPSGLGRDFPPAFRQPAGADIRRRLTDFLGKHTGKRFGDDLRAWRTWIWSLPPEPHTDYAAFKAELYARIDQRYRLMFAGAAASTIRLDEIDWGGVPVNGIPPLKYPKHIPASEAGWLRDGHIVFGVEVGDETRAYPKRILAWHELATDTLGGVDLTIVYCTLCGTVIPYESVVAGRQLTFGTSGLLYRSNKLMFDEETGSLWSSLEGSPVVGPLVGKGLRLTFRSVVTTTWGEWKKDHPGTSVLSLETGYERNYAEGAAYRQYFGSDRLMFEVPATDARLKNKAEVLVLRPEVLGPNARPVAIAVDRLKRQPLFAFEAGGRALVVITSKGGANRVYQRGDHVFRSIEKDGTVRDASGARWSVTTAALVGDSGERLPAVPAHRAFWFGWFAQHPDTELHR